MPKINKIEGEVLDNLGSIIRIMYGGNGSYKSTRLLFIRPLQTSIYYINFTVDLCFGRDARRHRFFFPSSLFCPLPAADCIFSVMINKFAGSHGGAAGKATQGKRNQQRSLCALIRLLFSRQGRKSRRRPSSPAHGKDEDAGDPEGRRRPGQSGFPCPDTDGSNNKRQHQL